MPDQDKSRAFSICVLDEDPKSSKIHSEIFSSHKANLMAFARAEEALDYIGREPVDLAMGVLPLTHESLLDFVEAVRNSDPDAALLIMHTDLTPEDIAILRGCGIQAVAPAGVSTLAYSDAIGGAVEHFFNNSQDSFGSSQLKQSAADSLMPCSLSLEASDIIDRIGTLLQLPEAPDDRLLADARCMAEAVGRIDSRLGLSSFEDEVTKLGKPRSAAALMHLCEVSRAPEQVWLMLRFLSFIPSYTTKLALEKLYKRHPNAKAREIARKSCSSLLKRFPIIFHIERLLSPKMGLSSVLKAAESIAQCDSELATDVLALVLANKRQLVQNAAIRGLGLVGTERALNVINKRLRILKLVRETAFRGSSYNSEQYLLYMEALATILKTADEDYPDAAHEVLADLKSDDKRTKLKAIEIVGLSKTPRCSELLADLTKSPDWQIRTAVLKAISCSPAPDAADRIREFVNDRNHTISNLAMQSLEELRVNDEIRKTLQDGHSRVKASAAAALGRLTDKESVGELMKLAFDDDREVSHEALKSLTKIADPACVPELEILLSRSNRPELVADAAYCMGKIFSDASLKALLAKAKTLMRSGDFRLPLLIRAIGSIINSERWVRNEELLSDALSLFEHFAVVSDDAVGLEVAGILLLIEGLNLRAYERMIALLESLAMRKFDPNPQRIRMVSIAKKAIERIRKKQQKLKEFKGTLDRISQVLDDMPARADGEKHRSYDQIGALLSLLPSRERNSHPAAIAGASALLAGLCNPNSAWRDKAAAIKSLSVIGDRRALPYLRELEKAQDIYSKGLAMRAMRAIIRKNLQKKAPSGERSNSGGRGNSEESDAENRSSNLNMSEV
ncbi:MAG: HEAT repeat domain-containing protein, partial [Candidatus Coatesbacteria bacterium]|nr:HEAT repeat domain-containing protein [Candidatus Coatesbacteria bacterium]